LSWYLLVPSDFAILVVAVPTTPKREIGVGCAFGVRQLLNHQDQRRPAAKKQAV
jgi:hypothetical protein